MDKTIEERANKFALEKHPYSPFYEEYTKMYIEIATEQRKIDIDKACEVFARFLQIINQKLDNKHVGVRFEEVGCMRDFRKELEE